MRKEGLMIASYSLKPEVLEPIKIWGFKLNESFMDLLLSIQMVETPNRKYPGYLAGRTALKAVVSYHSKDVIQFHANLEVIKRNQGYWFYTDQPIKLGMATAYINDWLRKECQKKQLSFAPMKWQDFGQFEELTLCDFLDNERFKNGDGVLARYFLLQLTKQPLPFVEETMIKFYPVISEGQPFIMTTPYFFKKRGPLSFAIRANIQEVPNQTERFLEFNTQVKLWVQENPIAKKGKYFTYKTSTHAYLHNPEITGETEIVFNQMPLRSKKDDIFLVNQADQYYCQQNDLEIVQLLDKERHDFDSKTCQVLLTVPTDARGDSQTLEGRKKGVSHSAYGVGLPEVECLMQEISKQLDQLGLASLPPMLNESKQISQVMDEELKETCFPQYGMDDLVVTDQAYKEAIDRKEFKSNEVKLTKKTNIPKKPYLHRSKSELVIGYATTSKLMEATLKGHVRLLLRAQMEVDEDTYMNEDQLKIRFVNLPMALSEAFSNKPLSSEFRRRSQLVKQVSQGLDGAFLEIEPMKNQNKDSKHFLRTEFSKYGVPLQFIHPTTYTSLVRSKMDLVNRGKACARDLLSKMGCIESELLNALKENEEKTIISVSRINVLGVKLPCVTKVTTEDSWIKVYPEENWTRIEDIPKQFSDNYIDNNESLWGSKSEDYLMTIQRWLKQALIEFEKAKNLLIYWDEAVETVLPVFELSEFDQFIKKFLPFELNQGHLIRWKSAIHAPDYINRKCKGQVIETGKYSGIYPHPMSARCYYLIGDRPENAQGKKDLTKLQSPGKVLSVPGMHQCYFYPDIVSKEAVDLLQLTQYLRRMVVTQNITASVPYPLYLVRHLNEQIESFAIRYVKDEEDK